MLQSARSENMMRRIEPRRRRAQVRMWRRWRGVPNLLFVTFVLLCLISFEASWWRSGLVRADALLENGVASDILFSGGDGRGRDEDEGVEGGNIGSAERYEDGEEIGSRRKDGVNAVREATQMLGSIKTPKHRPNRFGKPSGILGTIMYYTKELFIFLFMNRAPPQDSLGNLHKQPQHPKKVKLGQPLAGAVKLLEEAADESKNDDAIFLLAEINFHGRYSHPRNYSEAFRRYEQLADMTGNSTAQHMVGFMYATGIGGAVEQDQAKAILYHTFAAEDWDIRAEMTLGYRNHAGVATPKDCERAVFHYKSVADQVISYMRSGPPGGRTMSQDSYRIADEDGGVYGEGASVSSSGPNAKHGNPNSDAHAAFEDVLEYLDLMSRKGDLKATYSLAKLYYDGSKALPRDYKVAREYFIDIARKYWTRDGRPKNDVSPGTEKLASKAAGYLGRMFLRGEGLEQNFGKAQTWFRRGLQSGDALCQYSMGLMYLEGLGVPADAVKAAEYFAPSADQDFASAQVRLGALFLDQGDVHTATKYFELAVRHGHMEAYYYLAEMTHREVGRERSCGTAAAFYKVVAEKAESMLSSFAEANDAYESGDVEGALVGYLMAAEQGFEHGQANVAYLLDRSRPRPSLTSLLLPSTLSTVKQKAASTLQDLRLALVYWTRSAKQSNVDSLVKMGDYYLEGLGVDRPDSAKAAACYHSAADTMLSGQAMWNVGWMHENGIGIEQDFHLAKRFYDFALETNRREAYLPVKLALMKLRVRSYWNMVTDGDVNSIKDDPPPKKDWSLNEWITNFLDADGAWGGGYDDPDGNGPDYRDAYESGEWDGAADPDTLADIDDLYDELDSGIIESLIIIALAGALAFLVYYRQQRQQRARRRQQQQQRGDGQGGEGAEEERNQGANNDNGAGEDRDGRGGGGDRGLFPRPGDLDFNDWVAGGVGR